MEEEAEECSTNSDSKDSKEVEESGDAVPELLNISRTRCRIELETKVIQRFVITEIIASGTQFHDYLLWG